MFRGGRASQKDDPFSSPGGKLMESAHFRILIYFFWARAWPSPRDGFADRRHARSSRLSREKLREKRRSPHFGESDGPRWSDARPPQNPQNPPGRTSLSATCRCTAIATQARCATRRSARRPRCLRHGRRARPDRSRAPARFRPSSPHCRLRRSMSPPAPRGKPLRREAPAPPFSRMV